MGGIVDRNGGVIRNTRLGKKVSSSLNMWGIPSGHIQEVTCEGMYLELQIASAHQVFRNWVLIGGIQMNKIP